MNPLSSELPFHVHNWLIIGLKDFCIVIRKWPTFWPSNKNGTFWNYFKKHLMKIYTKAHQIAPFFKIILEELALEHLCHAQHAVSKHAYIHVRKKYVRHC